MAEPHAPLTSMPILPDPLPPMPGRKKQRKHTPVAPAEVDPNPDTNECVIDGREALRASPDAVGEEAPKPSSTSMSKQEKDLNMDPEAEGEDEADEQELKEALSRPPPVNSSYLPLPWKGRLGYVSS